MRKSDRHYLQPSHDIRSKREKMAVLTPQTIRNPQAIYNPQENTKYIEHRPYDSLYRWQPVKTKKSRKRSSPDEIHEPITPTKCECREYPSQYGSKFRAGSTLGANGSWNLELRRISCETLESTSRKKNKHRYVTSDSDLDIINEDSKQWILNRVNQADDNEENWEEAIEAQFQNNQTRREKKDLMNTLVFREMKDHGRCPHRILKRIVYGLKQTITQSLTPRNKQEDHLEKRRESEFKHAHRAAIVHCRKIDVDGSLGLEASFREANQFYEDL